MKLIYGWYNKNNLGDELFKLAFKNIYPNEELKFVNELEDYDINFAETIIFGGGSFLNQRINLKNLCSFDLLKNKNIEYIGVGGETLIHEQHLILLKLAKKIIIRNNYLEKFQKYNNNISISNDLVYNTNIRNTKKIRDKVVFIPNSCLIPNYNSPIWMHTAWNYFKSEFAQIFDVLDISILPMCLDHHFNDLYTGIEVSNYSKNKKYKIINYNIDEDIISDIFSSAKLVITQRYHGIVLSEMTNTPYIAISHNDKLSKFNLKKSFCIDYYGFNKNNILNLDKNEICCNQK